MRPSEQAMTEVRRERDLARRRDIDSPPGWIESTSVRFVAVRGDARDWAAYWMTYGELSDNGFGIDDIVDGGADDHIAAHGHKLDTTAARLQIFPNIDGKYRD